MPKALDHRRCVTRCFTGLNRRVTLSKRVGKLPGTHLRRDAAAVGYLRHLEPGREIVWWAPNDPFLGAQTWSAWQYTVVPEGDGSRLLMRIDLAAVGATRWLVILVLRDSLLRPPLSYGCLTNHPWRTADEAQIPPPYPRDPE